MKLMISDGDDEYDQNEMLMTFIMTMMTFKIINVIINDGDNGYPDDGNGRW